jgi:DNA-binding transcriptional regulator/RsmH inhibitor MraZ
MARSARAVELIGDRTRLTRSEARGLAAPTMLTRFHFCPLDKRGRLRIPREWRASFGDQLAVTAALGDDYGGLLFWPLPSLEALARDATTDEDRMCRRFYLGTAVELDVRANGTVRLPKHMRDFVSDADTLFGRGDRALWTNGQKLMRGEAATLQEMMRLALKRLCI